MTTVTLTRRGAIALIMIDNPPVNALATSVRAGLLAALRAVEADPATECAVIAAVGKTFVAGADIREMEHAPAEPILPDVLAFLAHMTKPVVAALHGHVLGGGLELSLACRGRVADRVTKLGFPEVKLGLVPGAGGTQRLIRLVPFDTAVSMVTLGRPVGAEQALEMGLVHAIADGDVVEAAISLLEVHDALPSATEIEQRAVELPDDRVMTSLQAAAHKSARGQSAPLAAFELMRTTAGQSFAEGTAAERALFLQLRSSTQAKALRRLFTAERESGRLPELAHTAHLPLQLIGVVGAGMMGCGIAFAALQAGFKTVILETDANALEKGRGRLSDVMDGAAKAGKLSANRRAELENAVTFSCEIEALTSCNLVIEAVFEDMHVKQAVLQRIAAVVSASCLIATNTSYLDVDALAASVPHPSRVLGLHFFSPAHVMRLIEVVRGALTSKEALATGIHFARAMGKIPVVTGVGDGFIGNRIFRSYRAVAEAMVEDGAAPSDIDEAMQTFGFPMGPFAVWDMAGLEISYVNHKAHPVFRPDGRRLDLLERLVDAGHLGRKNDKGWYAYEPGAKSGTEAGDVTALIAKARSEKGITPRAFSQTEITEALLAAMATEGQAILKEKIAHAHSDVDLVMVHGYGFPAHKGGPMFWSQQLSFGAPVGQ